MERDRAKESARSEKNATLKEWARSKEMKLEQYFWFALTLFARRVTQASGSSAQEGISLARVKI